MEEFLKKMEASSGMEPPPLIEDNDKQEGSSTEDNSTDFDALTQQSKEASNVMETSKGLLEEILSEMQSLNTSVTQALS